MTQTLDELEARSDERLAHLFAVIERAGLGDVSLGEAYLGRRGADVLTHLHGWHLFFEGWLDLDEEGAEVVLPQPDRTWDDLRIINDEIFERFRDLTYGEAKALLSSSHAAFSNAFAPSPRPPSGIPMRTRGRLNP